MVLVLEEGVAAVGRGCGEACWTSSNPYLEVCARMLYDNGRLPVPCIQTQESSEISELNLK